MNQQQPQSMGVFSTQQSSSQLQQRYMQQQAYLQQRTLMLQQQQIQQQNLENISQMVFDLSHPEKREAALLELR